MQTNPVLDALPAQERFGAWTETFRGHPRVTVWPPADASHSFAGWLTLRSSRPLGRLANS
jgi:hypothetical protein